MEKFKENRELRIFSGIGIILVVLGHLGYPMLEIGGLFPYYSFQVFIFVFVSGYFYKPAAEKQMGSYILEKFFSLIVPYMIWNLVYGLIATILHGSGFAIGEALSLKTLFLSPFLDGHQFMYNYPAWFVPVLFMLEIMNVCMRKILNLLHLNKEWLIFGCCLLVGILTVWFAIGGHVWGYYKIAGRLLFMFPGFQLGRLYKEKLEKMDTLSNTAYFILVMGIQILVTIFCGGLAFSAVWCTSFANGPIIPYVTIATGIAFWLRISKIIAQLPGIASKMVYIGRNTFSIMMHHTLGFMLVKGIFYLLHCYTPFCAEFDTTAFVSEINFIYLAGGSEASKWLYLAAGIGFALLIAKVQEMAGYQLALLGRKKKIEQ